jgi:CRP/FNR family transcriptional regulator, cyclic AMP receptor protein
MRGLRPMGDQRAVTISARVLAQPENEVDTIVDGFRSESGDRQRKTDGFLRQRFDDVSPICPSPDNAKEKRMASIATSATRETLIEDLLAHLPVSGTTEYSKSQIIFGPLNPSTNIYLVVTGKVGISKIAENGTEVLLEILRPDELFGESALLGCPRLSEQATAVERVCVMVWAAADIESLVMQRPRLSVALLQIVVQRNIECKRRIQVLSLDTIERRLARSLLRFSERLGARDEDGSIRMMPFTHEMLARYVGTSREIITIHMNQFRKQGWLQYSRDGIVIHSNMLKSFLHKDGVVTAGEHPDEQRT